MWIPHAEADPVCVEPRRTAADLAADVAAVDRALGPREPGRERVIALTDRYLFAVALLAVAERGEVARLPTSLAPEAVRDAAQGQPALHEGQAEGLDLAALLARPHREGPPATLRLPPEARVLVRLSTSGSSGTPRTVEKTVGQLVHEADTLRHAFAVPDRVRLVATVPPHHIYGLLFGVLVPLRAGGALHTDAPLLVEAVAARVNALNAEFLVTVPAHLRGLVGDGPNPFAGLSRIVTSGAPLSPDTAAATRDRAGFEVTEIFGSTETGAIGWRHQLAQARWLPLTGVTVSADADERLHLDSSFLAPDEPRPRPCDDRVSLHEDGRFSLHGRLDDVVKIASKRVSLGAVERLLLGAPGVRDAAVAMRVDGGRERLHALVVLEGSAADLRTWLGERLDAVAVPRLHLLPQLPREATGKLPRATLLATLDALAAPEPTSVELPFAVPVDHPGFQGHFPDQPVLPAVVQLIDLVLAAVRATWPRLGLLTQTKRLKFLGPVLPGAEGQISLVRTGSGVTFTVSVGEAVVARGRVNFEA